MRGAQQPISARVLASVAGTILDDSDFYPYGGERPITSSSGNRYKFEGKEQEQQQAQQGATQQQQQAQQGATQQQQQAQTQQLSAEDVTKVIQQAQKSSSDPVKSGSDVTITSKSKFDTNQNGILCLRPSTQIIPRLIDWATCSNGPSTR